ncbi:MAG: FAD-dependent oxidoreductase [Thermoleophilia bacterium]|nr:FAD-dependent oxidoreductase [Thermoleophilia bacterium]
MRERRRRGLPRRGRTREARRETGRRTCSPAGGRPAWRAARRSAPSARPTRPEAPVSPDGARERKRPVDAPRSLWIESTPETSYPALADGLEVDIAVVGGGIAGITAAFLLQREGRSVAVVDSKRILHGATGYTTAKVTAGHSVSYSTLEGNFGREGARTYAEAQQGALELVARLVEELAIDCDFERKANYVYAESPDERATIEEEVEAALRAGLAAELVEETPLPYPVECAFRLPGQAQFHPRKYLLRLAEAVAGDGGRIFEQTRATGIEGSGPCRVVTDRGTLTARDVVVSSHLPFLDRGFFFAKAHPERSYAVACRISREQDPEGMYINLSPPTRSVRTAYDEGGLLLLLGGEGHKPGAEPDTHARYGALEEFGRRHWGASEFPYRWSTQDYSPLDGVPYVGRLTRRGDHVYVATGFKKWGMTNGTAAAMILGDLVLGRDNPWAGLFDSKRLTPRASAPRFVKENATVARHFVGDRLDRGEAAEVETVAPGEGRMLRVRGRKTAVYRDEGGRVHALSPVCTHMGCHVGWNPAERSWDCPCHGSRFGGDGTVIQGPATRDLARRDLGTGSGDGTR